MTIKHLYQQVLGADCPDESVAIIQLTQHAKYAGDAALLAAINKMQGQLPDHSTWSEPEKMPIPTARVVEVVEKKTSTCGLSCSDCPGDDDCIPF